MSYKNYIQKTFIAITILTAISTSAQNYNLKQLEIIAKIWGECYLFHPSIVRADRQINWEESLVNFLPKIQHQIPGSEFIELVNNDLLSHLQDPFTVLQTSKSDRDISHTVLQGNKNFHYIRITSQELSDISNLTKIYNSLSGSKKSIVIDLRIIDEIYTDVWTNSCFDYLASMLIDTPIPRCMNVKREHYGWDEFNDWWFYEQRWKIAYKDKQISDNGLLLPFVEYSQELNQYIPEFNFESFQSISSPIVFIINTSFASYYKPLLIALKNNRPHTYIVNDNSGLVFTNGNQNLISYQFKNFDFILNTAFHINIGYTDIDYDINTSKIESKNITELLTNKKTKGYNPQVASLDIKPRKYSSLNQTCSTEERLLGIIKTWTIVEYFYPFKDRMTKKWDSVLKPYLKKAMLCKNNKAYYELIQNMMTILNDSHVSTYHPSLFDFSQIFIAPVDFHWIEEKTIVTSVDRTITDKIQIGDEIISIDGKQINDLLAEGVKTISSSNKQGLIATVINPGYFTNTAGSLMRLEIKTNSENKIVEIPRTIPVFQLGNLADKRPGYKRIEPNIGYLNLCSTRSIDTLINNYYKVKHTRGLILDLRNGYPTYEYKKLLEIISKKPYTSSIGETPIISASKETSETYEKAIYKIKPDTSEYYSNPIMVLIDKTMVSLPEDIAIQLQPLKNVSFIGEQTQGTDGEMTKISLPGGGETSFTGRRIKYANGEQFQGKGILPDYVVTQTIDGIKSHKDEILQKAIELLKK